MKTKLTITVDADILARAKWYALAHGVSLSSLIETSLKDLADGGAGPFAARWRGTFEPAERNDARYDALAARYL